MGDLALWATALIDPGTDEESASLVTLDHVERDHGGEGVGGEFVGCDDHGHFTVTAVFGGFVGVLVPCLGFELQHLGSPCDESL